MKAAQWYCGHADAHNPLSSSLPSQKAGFHACSSSTVLWKGWEQGLSTSPKHTPGAKLVLFCEGGEDRDSQRKLGSGHNKGTETKEATSINFAPENEPSNCRLAGLNSRESKRKLVWDSGKKELREIISLMLLT